MIARLLRHVSADLGLRRRFPRRALSAIEHAVHEEESHHRGQLRFAIEGGLPIEHLLRGMDARTRAVDVFARLGVWDTEHNCGVLIYVLLGDRAVEIVADRGIHARVAQSEWQTICRGMQEQFARGDFEAGSLAGIRRAGELLAAHFPAHGAHPNELPDKPAVL